MILFNYFVYIVPKDELLILKKYLRILCYLKFGKRMNRTLKWITGKNNIVIKMLYLSSTIIPDSNFNLQQTCSKPCIASLQICSKFSMTSLQVL